MATTKRCGDSVPGFGAWKEKSRGMKMKHRKSVMELFSNEIFWDVRGESWISRGTGILLSSGLLITGASATKRRYMLYTKDGKYGKRCEKGS
jgi:hypothetical protein